MTVMPDERSSHGSSRAELATGHELTQLLNAAASGDARASNQLLRVVYDNLRAIAQQRMASERPGHTLQATALVHEAYLRLLGKPDTRWPGRAQFFHAAA